MDPARAAAELLVAPPLLALAGPAGGGRGQPALFPLPIPAAPELLGVTLDAQGALVDPIAPAPPVGFTEARALTFGFLIRRLLIRRLSDPPASSARRTGALAVPRRHDGSDRRRHGAARRVATRSERA
jgi:hypothetical protein